MSKSIPQIAWEAYCGKLCDLQTKGPIFAEQQWEAQAAAIKAVLDAPIDFTGARGADGVDVGGKPFGVTSLREILRLRFETDVYYERAIAALEGK